MAAVGGDSIVILRPRDSFQLFLACNKKLFYWLKQHTILLSHFLCLFNDLSLFKMGFIGFIAQFPYA